MTHSPSPAGRAQNIAIIGPSFFGYLETLQEGFRARGIETRFYDERWSNSVATKLALRFLPMGVKRALARRHHEGIVREILERDTTHVLVISSELFPVAFLETLRAKGMVVVSYSFDSFANKPHMSAVSAIADAAASFDPDDCAAAEMTYIPLYSNVPLAEQETPFAARDIDVLYFGTLHSNRPVWISRAKALCEKNGWNGRFLLYFHNRLIWYVRFAFKPSVWSLGRLLTTTSFSSAYLTETTRNAKVVIDVHHPGQTGLTMRVFEALSCGSVVVSTNPKVETLLPEDLAATRVRHATPENLPRIMAEALELDPPELSEETLYYLSAHRYLDQLCALLAQADARAEPRTTEFGQ